jgi:hypothetical protein
MKWNAGSTRQVLWEYTGGISSVKLEYTTDNGTRWLPIADSVPVAIRAYAWTVPFSPSQSCRIRISDREDRSVSDVSDSMFTITRFELINARGGEAWMAGNTQTIMWASQNVGKVTLSVLPNIADARKLVWLRRDPSGNAWTNIGGAVINGDLTSVVGFHYLYEFTIGISSPPFVGVSAASVAIDQVGRGLSVDSTLTITNIGADTLVVDSIATGTPIFTVARSSARLTNKDTMRVSITMHPLVIGKHVDSLYIYNNSATAVVKIPLSGTVTTGMEPGKTAGPWRYGLSQNYPNPFNPSTMISFTLPANSFVSLKIFDALGRDVATIVSEELPAGTYQRQWNASGFPSGVYFYQLQAGPFTQTMRLVLLK